MTDSEFCDAFWIHKDVLYRFVYRMTGKGEAAEDIVQDCFLVLWRKPEGFDHTRGTLRAFLFGIARKLLFKRLRRESRPEAWDPDEMASSPIDIEGMERAEAVSRAVQALPPLQREVLILAEYEGMTLDEIVVVTGAELGAVKSRLHRARESLRRILLPLFEQKGNTYGTRQ